MAAQFTEGKNPGDWLKREDDVLRVSREAISLLTGNLATGTVLGKVTLGAASKAAKAGGNAATTGDMTLDATTPILANAQVGVYTVRCITAAGNGGVFRVTDPKGNVLGDVAVAATFANQIKFAIADGNQDFIVGEGFDVTIAAGSGGHKILAPAAVDGTQYAAGVLLFDTDASGAAVDTVAIVREAVVNLGGLTWPANISDANKATALAQLAVKEIIGLPQV